jgi:PhnB protein
MNIQPYLSFEGRCEEAIEFYQGAIGAKVEMMMRFKDAPDQSMTTAANKDKVLHSCIRVGDSAVMASDGECAGKASFQGIMLSLNVANEAEAKKAFAALGQGGQVEMPLSQTFFSPSFGMLTDRFGVRWAVVAE